jgi:hypothetical protein
VLQADKAALLKALAGGITFHKSAESCKEEVQGAMRALVELETRLKLETKTNQGQPNKARWAVEGPAAEEPSFLLDFSLAFASCVQLCSRV